MTPTTNVIDVIVKIKPDVYTELEEISPMQYFSFRATIGELDGLQKVNYIIDNAEDVSYPEAWTGTTVCYSVQSTTIARSHMQNSARRYNPAGSTPNIGWACRIQLIDGTSVRVTPRQPFGLELAPAVGSSSDQHWEER
jgi:hypothetical protein